MFEAADGAFPVSRVYNVETGKLRKCLKGSSSDEGALLKVGDDSSLLISKINLWFHLLVLVLVLAPGPDGSIRVVLRHQLLR